MKAWSIQDASSMIGEMDGVFFYIDGRNRRWCFDASGTNQIERIKEDLTKECRGYGVFRAYFEKVGSKYGLKVNRIKKEK